MFPDVVLQGRLVRLRPVTETDVPCCLRWLHAPDIPSGWHGLRAGLRPLWRRSTPGTSARQRLPPSGCGQWPLMGASGWGTWPCLVVSGQRPPSLVASWAPRGRGAKGTGPTRCGRRAGMPGAGWASGASPAIRTWSTSGRTAALRRAGSGRKGA
jgi:hypothetical protein